VDNKIEQYINFFVHYFFSSLSPVYRGIGGTTLLAAFLNWWLKKQESKQDKGDKKKEDSQTANATVEVARITDSASALQFVSGQLEKSQFRSDSLQTDNNEKNIKINSLTYDLEREKKGGQQVQERLEFLKEEMARKSKDYEEIGFRSALFLDSLPDIVWSARQDGFVDYLNRKYFDTVGHQLPEIEGWGWESFVHSSDIKLVEDMWKKSLATGANFEIIYRLYRAYDKSYRWQLTRATLVKIKDRGDKWVGISVDIDNLISSRNSSSLDLTVVGGSSEIKNNPVKILVADGDTAIWGVLKTLFKLNGWEGFFVEDGERAWDSYVSNLSSSPFDVIILELSIPKKTGEQVVRQIRESGDKKTPIFIVSANIEVLTLGARESLLLKGVLSKPFNLENLKREILNVLNLKVESEATKEVRAKEALKKELEDLTGDML